MDLKDKDGWLLIMGEPVEGDLGTRSWTKVLVRVRGIYMALFNAIDAPDPFKTVHLQGAKISQDMGVGTNAQFRFAVTSEMEGQAKVHFVFRATSQEDYYSWLGVLRKAVRMEKTDDAVTGEDAEYHKIDYGKVNADIKLPSIVTGVFGSSGNDVVSALFNSWQVDNVLSHDSFDKAVNSVHQSHPDLIAGTYSWMLRTTGAEPGELDYKSWYIGWATLIRARSKLFEPLYSILTPPSNPSVISGSSSRGVSNLVASTLAVAAVVGLEPELLTDDNRRHEYAEKRESVQQKVKVQWKSFDKDNDGVLNKAEWSGWVKTHPEWTTAWLESLLEAVAPGVRAPTLIQRLSFRGNKGVGGSGSGSGRLGGKGSGRRGAKGGGSSSRRKNNGTAGGSGSKRKAGGKNGSKRSKGSKGSKGRGVKPGAGGVGGYIG